MSDESDLDVVPEGLNVFGEEEEDSEVQVINEGGNIPLDSFS